MCLLTINLIAQTKVTGIVNVLDANMPIYETEIFDKVTGQLLTTSNKDGYFEFTTDKETMTIVFFSYNYKLVELNIVVTKDLSLIHI